MPTNLDTHTTHVPPTTAASHEPRLDLAHTNRSQDSAGPHVERAQRALVLRVKSAVRENPYFRGRLKLLQIDSPDNRSVTITGCLPSFYLKQILQTIVQQVDGVEQVKNDVVVQDP